MFSSTRKKGRESENIARKFLESCGYGFLAKNYATMYGEIDLIMEDSGKETLIFVEVKSGNSDYFSAWKESITQAKCEKISKVALAYIENLNSEYKAFRIDAVFVERGSTRQIQHLKNIYIS